MLRTLSGAGVAALLAAAACAPFESPGRPPPAALGARTSPAPPLRPDPPAQLLLDDADLGFASRGYDAHLGLEQAIRDEPDQFAALDEMAAWGWLDAATRSWPGARAVLVLTAREEGAARAFRYWAAAAAREPYAALPCPYTAAPIEDCRLGLGGDRARVAGRRGRYAFLLECPGSEAERLLRLQARRLAIPA